MSRAARIALLAGVLALIALAGGAGLIVSQTKVSPDAIRSSATRSEAVVEKAWALPAASTFWLIERGRLFAAMDTWDGKKKRGLLLIE
jgi:hypothetical protein